MQNTSEEQKEKNRLQVARYRATPEGRAAVVASRQRYLDSAKGQATIAKNLEESLRKYHEDPAYRQAEIERAREYRNRPEVVAWRAYVLAHSKLARKVASLQVQVTRLKAKHDPRYFSAKVRLKQLNVEFKAERKVLRAEFETSYKEGEPDVDTTKA